MQPPPRFSVIIPARNEEALIGATLSAALAAVAHLHGYPAHACPHLSQTAAEIIVVDNMSTDSTRAVVQRYGQQYGVQLAACAELGAPRARNMGARLSQGRVLVFVDADTCMERHTLTRIAHRTEQGYQAGITRLASLEGGTTAWYWWTFWEYVRLLPLARAKAMPALMFCTRDVFERFGPFDEAVSIGEEWPILASLYRTAPRQLIYDRSVTGWSSSRRMDMQPFGYLRTFGKYVWAVLHPSGRVGYTDRLRHRVTVAPAPAEHSPRD